MKKNYYRITLQYNESKNIIEHDIVLDKNVSIYMIPSIAVDQKIITLEEVNYIASITPIKEKDSKALFYQANQIVLRPRKNYGTGKQFSHLMKDLNITDDNYTIMLDNGKITKDEITIVIYPKKFKDMEDMMKRTISQVISTLNLNSTKIVSVNYILCEELNGTLVDNEQNNTYIGNYKCTQHCCDEGCCEDCSDECKCKDNPNLDCCKSCEISHECGCYNHKINRNEFTYTKKSEDSKDPEKTLRIPINPINPKDEIIMLANAIAKRLAIISESDGCIEIRANKNSDDGIGANIRLYISEYFDL